MNEIVLALMLLILGKIGEVHLKRQNNEVIGGMIIAQISKDIDPWMFGYLNEPFEELLLVELADGQSCSDVFINQNIVRNSILDFLLDNLYGEFHLIFSQIFRFALKK